MWVVGSPKTESKTCSCGATSGICYETCVASDGSDCATNDCATFTCCCPSYAYEFDASCCVYDTPTCSDVCSTGSLSVSCSAPLHEKVSVGTTECGNTCYECQCSSEYKYSCSGAGASGSGNACDGKYQSCDCGSGYYDCGSGYCCPCKTTSSCPLSPDQWEAQIPACNRVLMQIDDMCGGKVNCYVAGSNPDCSSSSGGEDNTECEHGYALIDGSCQDPCTAFSWKLNVNFEGSCSGAYCKVTGGSVSLTNGRSSNTTDITDIWLDNEQTNWVEMYPEGGVTMCGYVGGESSYVEACSQISSDLSGIDFRDGLLVDYVHNGERIKVNWHYNDGEVSCEEYVTLNITMNE